MSRKLSLGDVNIEIFTRREAIAYIKSNSGFDCSDLTDEELWGELCTAYTDENLPLYDFVMLSVPDRAQTQQFWDEVRQYAQELDSPPDLESFTYNDFYY
jgi:hypothetical protein